ncbi:ArdC family protein [Mucilaginibacter sp. HD30]
MTATAEPKQAADVYGIVTDRIIEQLERNVIPWRKPWAHDPPRNFLTMAAYRGINLLLLAGQDYSTNYYLTFDQLKAAGGSVLKDEKAHLVVFYKRTEKEKENPDDKQEYLSVLRYYRVFNVAQCRDIPERLFPSDSRHRIPALSACEEIVERMPNCPQIRHGRQGAWYDPQKDCVTMPKQGSFASPEGYYHTLFHELIHSTGHQSRLSRKEVTDNVKYGSEPYSIEELTAEVGACFLGSVSGVGIADLENSAAYIGGWLEKLRGDGKLILYAASRAQKAVDFILSAPAVPE